jgi:hypothetical protein
MILSVTQSDLGWINRCLIADGRSIFENLLRLRKSFEYRPLQILYNKVYIFRHIDDTFI